MLDVADLPGLNAILNTLSAVCVLSGFYFIRKKNVQAHKTCMIAALLCSGMFLTSYLYYHSQVGSVRFEREGWIRQVYLAILLTHTILAGLVLPMALRTAFLGLRSQFAGHVRIARWTLPVWIYVSVTGVVIYWMLYRLR